MEQTCPQARTNTFPKASATCKVCTRTALQEKHLILLPRGLNEACTLKTHLSPRPRESRMKSLLIRGLWCSYCQLGSIWSFLNEAVSMSVSGFPGWVEGRKPPLNVDGTIPWAVGPDWLEPPHSSSSDPHAGAASTAASHLRYHTFSTMTDRILKW